MTWKIALYSAMVFVISIGGCKKEPQTQKVITDLDRIQGTWKGTELGGRSDEWILVITGDKIQVDGPGPEDYAGTITIDESTTPKSGTLKIETCAFDAYIGKVAQNIYKLEGDTLTWAGTEPGSGMMPTSFEGGNGTRVFEVKKQHMQ